MKRTLQVLIALAISSIFLVSPVAAASNQGLSWTVAKGDAFNYHMTTTGGTTGTNLNEACFMNVTDDPPAIPNSITDWTQVPNVDIDIFWHNGTSIGLYGLLFLGLLSFGTGLVVPVGNYTLLGNVVKTYILWNSTALSYANSSLYWGLKYTGTQTKLNTVLQISFLKSDGVLARYIIDVTNNTSHKTTDFSFIRDNLPSEGFDVVGFLQQNMLVVGGVVAVIVILGIVVCIRKK
jgi:hypothetical protein